MKHQFPWRIFYRTLLIQSCLILLALFLSALAARYFFKRQFIEQMQSQLRDSLTLLSKGIQSRPGPGWCRASSQGSGVRVTLVERDGKVICDSDLDATALGNYAERPEVRAAIAEQFGQNLRYSESAKEELFYGALYLPAHALVVRGAIPLARLNRVTEVFDTSLSIVLGGLALFLGLVATWVSRQLVFPLGRLLVKTQQLISRRPEVLSREELTSEPFGEWSELESNIDDIRKNLERTDQTLRMEQVELDMVMAAINDAILAVDPEGMPLFFNSRFELVFSRPGFRTKQRKFWEIFREPEVLEAYRGALHQGRGSATKPIAFEREGEPRRYFSLSVSPLRRQGGVIYGALGIFHDVTELKTAEQMRIDFVANVSHELRTPLTSIKGYAETLRTDVEDKRTTGESAREYLDVISRNANRLMNLMEDLLNLSALESSTLLHLDHVATKEITERVFKTLENTLASKNHKLDVEYDVATLLADPHRLEQVLVNLLDNAIKYTPNQGKIRISWVGQGKDVYLKVSDSGPGIPVQHQARLFERFYRVDKARSREQGGTGLGLAIVKHILQRHHGTVWVESKPGEGSTFVCQFPQDATPGTEL